MYELINMYTIGVAVLAGSVLGILGWWKKNTVSGNLLRLKHAEFVVRREAADALGKLGDKRSVEPLIQLLQDNLVQQSALEALSHINHPKAKTITQLSQQLCKYIPKEKVPKFVLTAKQFAEEGYSFHVVYQKEEGYFKHHEEEGYWNLGNHWNGVGGTPGAVDEWIGTPAWDEWIATTPEKLEIVRGEKLDQSTPPGTDDVQRKSIYFTN